jgi:glycosyltransferase involved in cell wall biosynthesis
MRVYYRYTKARNGGFGVYGKAIKRNMANYGFELVEDNPDILFTYGVPDEIIRAKKRFPDTPIVHYTVWESSKYEPNWAESIKKEGVDLVLTAGKYSQRALERSGIDSKVWNHAIENRWQYKERKDDDVYTFLHYNAYEWRKGWDLVFKAFIDEFDPSEPVKLVFKCRERNEGIWIRPDGQDEVPIDHNFEELVGHISNQAMVDMLDNADCGVFPVRGEGWFLPSFEMVATGIPCILPNYGNMSEQFGSGYYDVELEGFINAEPRYPGAMIEPSLSDLRNKMRYCYEHEEEGCKWAAKGSKRIHKNFNFKKIMKQLKTYFNLIIN